MWCTCDTYLPQLIAHSEQRSKTIDRFLTTAFSCSGSAGLVASLAWLEVTNSHMPPPKKTSPRIYTFLTGAFSDYKMPENPLFILYFLCTCLKFLIFHGGNYPLLPPPPDAHGNESIFCRRFARWSCHSPPRPYTRPRPHPGRGVSVTGRLRGKDFLLAYFRSFSAHRPTNNEIHHVRNRSIYIQCLLLQARKPSSVI